jgi:DNA-binding XRE family transcriptional regulator
MKLSAWIKKSKIKRVDVAKQLGITYRALYNYERGRRPLIKIAQRIVKLSGDQVTYDDLAK